MSDTLPEDSRLLHTVEQACTDVLHGFGYDEIRLPLLEKTELFVRSIGGCTDIVQKEMYTFDDRGGDSLTLRPEGTAGCARAVIENGLTNTRSRFWYSGPFFRRERPQKGRRRQFHQVGAEAFGITTPELDAELILISAQVWERLGINGLELRLNSLGTPDTRCRYREKLVVYLQSRVDELDEDSRRRLHDNPLRVIDSKDPGTRRVLEDGPRLDDFLDNESQAHFEFLQTLLGDTGVAFRHDPFLVRGLDYYTKTVFEWVVPDGGAQSTVCAGGRYDGLVEQLGGKPTPAAGFAIGVERVALLCADQPLNAVAGARGSQGVVCNATGGVYFVALGEQATRKAHRLALALHRNCPEVRLILDCASSFKAQMRHADKSSARLALILGDDEVRDNVVTLKDLRGDGGQFQKSTDEAVACIRQVCCNKEE